MQTKHATPAAPAKTVKPAPRQEGNEKGGTEVLVKIAIPLVLALVAAVLNASAVARQMKTQTFIAYSKDLPIGHVVGKDDLAEVKIGGDLGQIPYLLHADTARSELVGRVVDRPIKKGELVVEGQFGGVSVAGQELVPYDLDRDETRALGHSIRPGQWFYVKFQERNQTQGKDQITNNLNEIGPFQVAPVDKTYRTDSTDYVIRLNMYYQDPNRDQEILILKDILGSGHSGKYRELIEPIAYVPQVPVQKSTMNAATN